MGFTTEQNKKKLTARCDGKKKRFFLPLLLYYSNGEKNIFRWEKNIFLTALCDGEIFYVAYRYISYHIDQ